MPADARFSRGPEAVFAAQIAIVFAGFHFGSLTGWIGIMLVIALLGLLGWKIAYDRARIIADLPTSRVASAAQGYVELHGTAANHDGYSLFSKHGHVPCVWFCFVVEERRGNEWRRVNDGTSPGTFLLRDRTGECMIDPEGAEVVARHKRIWSSAPYRFTEWVIREGDPLYALGAFSTIDGADSQVDPAADMRALLAEWKRDQPALIARFDSNGDGKIDLAEWERARESARAEIDNRERDFHQMPGLHVMRKPADGRLFVLSNLDPSDLMGRYRWWSIAQFGILCASAAAAAMLAVRLHLV